MSVHQLTHGWWWFLDFHKHKSAKKPVLRLSLKAIKYVSGCVKGCGAVCVKILKLVLVAEVNIENICLFFVNFAFFLCHRATITAMICGWCSGGQSQITASYLLLSNQKFIDVFNCKMCREGKSLKLDGYAKCLDNDCPCKKKASSLELQGDRMAVSSSQGQIYLRFWTGLYHDRHSELVTQYCQNHCKIRGVPY